MEKVLTLSFIIENDKILLVMKKRGFGANKWNGYGGKLEPGESVEEAAIREVDEEIGIKVEKLKKHGIILFKEEGQTDLRVHIFQIGAYSGDPIESEEMKPRWFDLDKIPYDEMWSDDKYWLPLLLDHKYFEGEVVLQDDKVVTCDINELSFC